MQFAQKINKFDVARQNVETKYAPLIKAEMTKLEGKEISYRISDELKKELWYDLKSSPKLYVDSSNLIGVMASFKQAANQPEGEYWFAILVKYVSKDGVVIATGDIGYDVLEIDGETKEEYNDLNFGSFDISGDPELWNELSEIVFCTNDEYHAASDEVFKNQQKYKEKRVNRNNALGAKAMNGLK